MDVGEFWRWCWCNLRGVFSVVFLRRNGEVPYFSGESESSDSHSLLAGRWRVERGKGKSSEEEKSRELEDSIVSGFVGPFLINY